MTGAAGRPQVALAPATAARIDGFPASTIRADKVIYRAHRATLGPWWFCRCGDCRFDLPAPRGTCYLAENRVAALQEALGVRLIAAGVVDQHELTGRVISALRLPGHIQVANTTSAKAANHGVTREISTVVPYTLTRRWAQAWATAGFDGIRYLGRLSTNVDPKARCLAIFGAAGAGDTNYAVDPDPEPAVDTARAAGITIVDTLPRTGALTVIPPPSRRSK